MLLVFLSAVSLAIAYEVPFSDSDYSRQVCSGMWGGLETYINVTFDAGSSHGQVAMVIYEWKDVKYIGRVTSETDDSLPKTYVCTTDAVKSGLCSYENIGKFIFGTEDPSDHTLITQTSFWTASVSLSPTGVAESSSPSFWEDPQGNPTPPSEDNTSPWLQRGVAPVVVHVTPRDNDPLNPSPSGTLAYTSPIQYQVRNTGYYCVGKLISSNVMIVVLYPFPTAIVPVTVISPTAARQTPTDVPFHPTYDGVVLFRNTFDGELPAADYPKVNFYLVMFFAYALFGSAWAYICYKHLTELLPIQYYLTGLIGFLVIEMVANWVYYRYLNAHDKNMASTVFLFVVAILDAGRNALSFFMLLVVSLGLSVVRESLGKTMLKCKLLAGAHFIFGVLYAVGIVELELESTSALVLLLFIIPLAFTLSGFLMWILYSLNGTMTQLTIRKQRYKLTMFKRLYYILLATVVIITIFFVWSSMAFSDRLAEDLGAYGGGYLTGTLRSSTSFRSAPISTLAMSDEIAQEDEDAEDYDLEALQHRTAARDDDEITLVNNRREPEALAEDHVVFEIGDEDAGSDDETEGAAKKRRGERKSVDENETADEREGLIGGRQHKDRND
ncbi:lung seven transmembrane receptor-domain-containing protein [Lanmaoa asiatica]|nr:lung seven transmembrane receptor-domain-containing protein [Lanmaoa asiatica]